MRGPYRLPACRSAAKLDDRSIVPDVFEDYRVDSTLIPAVDRIVKVGRITVARIVSRPENRPKRPAKVNELRLPHRPVDQRCSGLDHLIDFFPQHFPIA